jgi:DNA-binding transcriptional MerR regulator
MEALVPDKFYFKIGEVAQFTSLRPSVLRYWETEFELLNPHKSRTGQRLYTKKDLELIFEIKKLLYIEKLTIAGAKNKLRKQGNSRLKELDCYPDKIITVINEVREELVKIRNSL